MMGLEIKHDRVRNGYYNADPSQQLPAFDLTVGEVFALTLAKEMLSEYTGTPFQAILQDALEKIQQRLPEKVLVEVGDVEGAVFFGRVPAIPFSRKMFLDLYHACANNEKVKIEYFSAYKGEFTTRTVDPYRVLAHQNTWYLVAFCNLRQDLRLFALHRIQHHELIGDKFEPMDNAKLDDWLKSPLFIEHQEQEFTVSIKFEPRAARYVKEKIWHPSQDVVDHKDGSCTLTFTTAGIDEVKRWLLAYGPEAEVLGPPSLRSSVASDLKRAAEKYRDEDR
jgi:predicted DNA-binding transcriptional regulator YafY